MKRVALINDLSGFGKCSLTAAIPVISVMGIQACPLPTAILTAQTGFEDYFCDDFTDKIDIFTQKWEKMGVDFEGIYSGYLAGPAQVDKVFNFLEKFQRDNTLYLADPVMGDHGKFYSMFDEKMLEAVKRLTRKADVITPNLTELCMLADENYEEVISHRQDENYIEQIKVIGTRVLALAKREQSVVVTGIIRSKDNKELVGNLAISKDEAFYVENTYTGMGFSGTGDLFASVVCGSLVKGLSLQEAMKKATYFLQDAIEEASNEKIPAVHGVYFEKYLPRLL